MLSFRGMSDHNLAYCTGFTSSCCCNHDWTATNRGSRSCWNIIPADPCRHACGASAYKRRIAESREACHSPYTWVGRFKMEWYKQSGSRLTWVSSQGQGVVRARRWRGIADRGTYLRRARAGACSSPEWGCSQYFLVDLSLRWQALY